MRRVAGSRVLKQIALAFAMHVDLTISWHFGALMVVDTEFDSLI